jgi:aspartate/glutamate racemase
MRLIFLPSGVKGNVLMIQTLPQLWSNKVFLENSGAHCIVMPCNISHSWHDEVSKGCSVPFLHMHG